MRTEPLPREAAGVTFTREQLAQADYDARGIHVRGRAYELELLLDAGRRDPSYGRLLEGHLNAVQLVARFGTEEQRLEALGAARAGRLFGTWNTQDTAPVRLERREGEFILTGAKTWCSGADTVMRGLITAATPEGSTMCLVPMERANVVIDDTQWQPLGMEDSRSFGVCFDGVRLDARDVIGAPGDYARDPWFLGGALRFAAVHAGIIERIASETFAFLNATGRNEDPHAVARAGELAIGAANARNWIEAGTRAWLAFDRAPSTMTARNVVQAADMARLGIERIGLDALERCTRSVGARGLLEPNPFARLIRDFTMYLRQPAPDATLARVGRTALTATRASGGSAATG